MSFNLDQWIAEVGEGAFSPDEVKQVKQIFGSKELVTKRLTTKQENELRQSDYSRQVAEARRQQESAAATIRANTDWKQQAEAALATAMRERDAERTTRAQYEAELTRIENEYGVEVKRATAAPPPDPTKPVTPTEPPQFKKDIDDLRLGMSQTPQLMALVMDLNAENYDLFGKPIRNAREIIAESMKSGRTVRDVWEEKNGVPDRRAQIQRDADAAKEAQIRSDERTRVISEMSAPQQHRLTPSSTVFEKVTPGSAPGQNSGVLAAVSAFNAGKYKAATP